MASLSCDPVAPSKCPFLLLHQINKTHLFVTFYVLKVPYVPMLLPNKIVTYTTFLTIQFHEKTKVLVATKKKKARNTIKEHENVLMLLIYCTENPNKY